MEVATAVIAFGTVILKISKELRKAAKKVRTARREIMELVKEMGIFSDLYEDFYRVCVSDQRKKGRNTFPTQGLIDWIQDAIKAFKSLVYRVRALTGDSKYSMLETITAHVKWLRGGDEVEYLRCALSVARENMRGFTNLKLIEAINEEMQLIQDILTRRDQREIEDLEIKLGITLEERLEELKSTSYNRRKQRYAINERLEDAFDELAQQTLKVSANAFVPESTHLEDFANIVEDYAENIQERRRSNTTSTVLLKSRSAKANSARATNSTASRSFVSKPSSTTEQVIVPSAVTSTEELDKTFNDCGRCTGACECSDTESRSAISTNPPSLVFMPPRRKWQKPASNDLLAQLIKEAFPLSPAESSTRKGVVPDHDQRPQDAEYESDDMQDVGGASDEDTQSSPFRAVAGVQGKFPPKWRNRQQRRESTGDHWHKRL